MLSAYVSHHVDGTLGIKRQKATYDCSKICPEDIVPVIIPLHIFTGSDAAAAFFGHGKKAVYDNVVKSRHARQFLQTLGSSLPVSQNTLSSMTEFTIQFVYNDKVSKTLGEAHASKWKMMKRKSTLRIPPDQDSLQLKITRANYQVFVLKNFHQPLLDCSPLEHGWILNAGKCLPLRNTKSALPERLHLLRDSHAMDIGTETLTDSDSCGSDADEFDDFDTFEY